MLGFSYEGPRAMLYRAVWVLSAASAALFVALPIASRLTANDFAIGLLLKSVEYFAFGLGTLGSLFFVLLLVCTDVSKAIKLRALVAVALPYVVIAILWLIARTSTLPRA
jgi:hypothetical protein